MTVQEAAPYDTIVLVVDDDTAVRDMAATSLRRAGYKVQEAANGADAIAVLRRCEPHLILTDIYMPECDGIELIRTLRFGSPPIIAMSGGYAGMDYLDISATFGAVATIRKPFAPQELQNLVANVLSNAPRR